MSKALVAAQSQSPLCLVMGYGDGQVANALAENPQKDVIVLALPGDPADCPLSRGRVARISSTSECRAFTLAAFGAHPDIPPLAGAHLIDDHPLSADAAEARDRLLPDLRLALKDQPQLYGNDIIDSFMGLYHAAKNAPTLLRAPFLGDNAGLCGDVPVISIAAGPTLKRHLPRLYDLQERALLISCDSALPGLIAAGIVPHLVAPLERLQDNARFMPPAAGTRCRYAGLPVCHPDALIPFGDHCLAVAGYDRLYDWFWPDQHFRVMTGSSTGVLTLSLSFAVGRGPIYLVGHDLSTIEEESHWDGAAAAGNQWKAMKQVSVYGHGYEDRWIPGNNGGIVRSIAWWDRFRHELGLLCRAMKRPVVNVNAFHRVGAVIEHTESADLPDPGSLPVFSGPDWRLPPIDRLGTWRAKAKQLPADVDGMLLSLETLRRDLTAERIKPAHTWNVGALVDRMSLTQGVSDANAPAFGYALRSALFNNQAVYHADLMRCQGPNRARWVTMDALDSLCASMESALTQLRPCLEEVSRGETQNHPSDTQ